MIRVALYAGSFDPLTNGHVDVIEYWRSPSMALGWAGADMQEAAEGFRHLKAYKQRPLLQAALSIRKARATSTNAHLVKTTKAA